MILVTGANRGIGLRIAETLAASNRPVFVTTREEVKLQSLLLDLKTKFPKAEIQGGVMDTSSDASIRTFFAGLTVTLETVINNAAICLREGWTQHSFDETIRTNVTGPLLVIELFLAKFPQGKIVNVTSGYGQLANQSKKYRGLVSGAETIEELKNVSFDPNDAGSIGSTVPAYKLSKAILNRATQLLARDGAWAVASCPGWVRTDMGGAEAPRDLDQGATSILKALDTFPPGSFSRDGVALPF